ncbi:SGNH/GDSL hydrolase family protein [Mastigocladopsis repens]|uniref:SGNH/GDSL hydrolase family protein n=1 Tax=Mastigocladopsis repens TaxID=221287 RepID=UPI000301E038|nr:SGNH/GDSL hydrolase family protein [Mastigocladopsis repens]
MQGYFRNYQQNFFKLLAILAVVTVIIACSSVSSEKKFAVFFGDSITAGNGVSITDRWSNLVSKSVRMREINEGISATVLQNTSPVLADNGRDRVSNLAKYSASKIYILYGLNDLRYNGAKFSVANFENDLREIIAILINQASISPKDITIGSPPYIDPAYYTNSDFAPFNAGSTLKHQAYIKATQKIAQEYKCNWANVYQAMIDKGANRLLQSDHIHPNVSGHSVIADSMLNAY